MKKLVDYALSFTKIPYRWAGDDPMAGFDCSGYLQEVLASVGMDPRGDQTSQALHDDIDGRPVPTALVAVTVKV